MAQETVREAVGVFHDTAALQKAVDDLLIAGFDRAWLSVMAAPDEVWSRAGHENDEVADLEDDPNVPRQTYVSDDSRTEGKGVVVGVLVYVGALAAAGAIALSGGTILAAAGAAAAAGGAGGALGALIARRLGRRHADHLQEQLDRGGILLWVRTPDPDSERRACEIIRRHAADDVHVHELPTAPVPLEGGVSRDTSFMKRLGL
jgi:hypothetical protein